MEWYFWLLLAFFYLLIGFFTLILYSFLNSIYLNQPITIGFIGSELLYYLFFWPFILFCLILTLKITISGVKIEFHK